jgi:hypothetical protein
MPYGFGFQHKDKKTRLTQGSSKISACWQKKSGHYAFSNREAYDHLLDRNQNAKMLREVSHAVRPATDA